jgi:hypothetical protein
VQRVTVEFANVLRLLVQIERVARFGLHAISEFERLNPCFEFGSVLPGSLM